jgi:hypothetical protein
MTGMYKRNRSVQSFVTLTAMTECCLHGTGLRSLESTMTALTRCHPDQRRPLRSIGFKIDLRNLLGAAEPLGGLGRER